MADRKEEAFTCEPIFLTQALQVTDTKQQADLFTQQAVEQPSTVWDALCALEARGEQESQQKRNLLRATKHLGITLVQEVTSACMSCGMEKQEKEPRLTASATPCVVLVTTRHLHFLAPEHQSTCSLSHVFSLLVHPFAYAPIQIKMSYLQ